MTIQYDPQEVTDWLTPLEKVYERQSRQLDTYHNQLRERDRQEEAAVVDVPEMFSKLASFSSSVRKAVDARKAGKAKKKEADMTKHEIERIKQIQDPAKIEEAVERLVESDKLKVNRVEYKEMLDTLDLSDKDHAYMLSLHGGGILKEREFLAYQVSKNLNRDHRAFLTGTSEESAAASLKWQESANDPEARALQVKQFALDRYKKLGFTKTEFIADNYWQEIDKKVNTATALENIKASKTVLTERSITINNDIDVARGKLINDKSALTKQLQLHIKEGVDPSRNITVEDSKENYTVRLERLGSTGDLTDDELDLMKTGQLAIKHSAGTTGEILLKPEQWQRVQKSINTYNESQVNLRNESIKAGATNAINALYKGNLTETEAKKLKNDTLLDVRNTLGEQSKEYKALDAVDPTAQIKGAYESAKANYPEIFNGNDISKVLQLEKDIELEPNGKVKAELKVIVEETKAALRAANLPDNWSDYLDTIKGDMISDSGLDRTLDPDRAFTRNQERVQLFVAKKKLNTLIKTSRIGESVDTADGIHEAWLKKHGWGQANGGGMLSPNGEGVFERFEFIKNAKIQNTTKPSKFQQETWTGRIHNTTNDFKGDIEAALNKAESYIDKEDSLGAFIEKVNKEGDPEVFYSPELITKSLALGRQPSYVLKKSIEALIANGDYKDFVKKFDLKKKLELLDKAPDLKLKGMLEELGNKDLISSYNYAGGFTPNQGKRIANMIKKEALTESVAENQAKQQAKNTSTPTPTPSAENRLNFKERFPQFMDLSEEELNQKIIELLPKIQEILN